MTLRYFVEFRLLPQMLYEELTMFVDEVLSNGEDGMKLTYDVASKVAGEEHSYTADDFKYTVNVPEEGVIVAMFKMPEEGMMAPYCRSVIIVLDLRDDGARHYFTEEYHDGEIYFLGKITEDGSHVNYGTIEGSDEEKIKTVLGLID